MPGCFCRPAGTGADCWESQDALYWVYLGGMAEAGVGMGWGVSRSALCWEHPGGMAGARAGVGPSILRCVMLGLLW